MSGPFLGQPAERPPRRSRVRLVLGALAVLVALVGGALGAAWFVERDVLPARTTIAGLPLGGLTLGEAELRLGTLAARALDHPIRLAGPGGVEQTHGRALGAVPLIEVALADAREPNVLMRIARRIGLGADREIPLAYALRAPRLAELAAELDERFADPPRDATVKIAGVDVRVTAARAGTKVDRTALNTQLRELQPDVRLRLVDADPVVSDDEARIVADRVTELLRRPRVVKYRDVAARLWPRRLASLVRTEPSKGALVASLDPEGLRGALRPRLGRFERPPRDAGFFPRGARVDLIPAREGNLLDGIAIGRSLLKNLDAGAHLARFVTTPPEFTTEEAKKLRIVERISEFTTYHSCCQGRVTNIHRGADIIDGTIILPGQRFSLNEVMGKRTPERGFVSAPQIFAGRLEDAVGGGVSQIATTMYNAAFFAGVQIITHQPHEFYISRYPMGREATVSWGGPELIWRNDWPAAILVDMSYTDTSITVRFYSRKLGRRVETTTGAPCCYTSPQTITVSNSSLPAGTTRTVQSAGPSGFSISYTRKVYRGKKLKRNERYTWNYRPENAIVEVGPAKPAKPKPKPKPDPDPKPGAPPPDEPPAAGAGPAGGATGATGVAGG